MVQAKKGAGNQLELATTVKCCRTCLHQLGRLFTYSPFCAARSHNPYWFERGQYWVPPTMERKLI